MNFNWRKLFGLPTKEEEEKLKEQHPGIEVSEIVLCDDCGRLHKKKDTVTLCTDCWNETYKVRR